MEIVDRAIANLYVSKGKHELQSGNAHIAKRSFQLALQLTHNSTRPFLSQFLKANIRILLAQSHAAEHFENFVAKIKPKFWTFSRIQSNAKPLTFFIGEHFCDSRWITFGAGSSETRRATDLTRTVTWEITEEEKMRPPERWEILREKSNFFFN